MLGSGSRAEGVKHKSVILLWMDGGPSHTHTFDMKPKSQYKFIQTSVPGIQVCEHLPRVAQQMQHLAILRGMSTPEGDHNRARYLIHTGYRIGEAGIAYPDLASIVSAELGDPEAEMPNAVVVAPFNPPPGPGHLGPLYAPVVIRDPAKGMEDLKAMADLANIDRRVDLVDQLDQEFRSRYQAETIEAHRKGYRAAARLLHSTKPKAFDLGQEPEPLRKRYGESKFAQSCLLARRLVEAGVPFVEVALGNWDSHSGAAQNGHHKKQMEQLDTPMAALIADLQDRGLLDQTLVIWMGEFGRSPIGGGDHYARAWTTVLGVPVSRLVKRLAAPMLPGRPSRTAPSAPGTSWPPSAKPSELNTRSLIASRTVRLAWPRRGRNRSRRCSPNVASFKLQPTLGVRRAMFPNRIKLAAAVLFGSCVLAAGMEQTSPK